MKLSELNDKIDAVAAAVKEAVADLEDELDGIEEAGTNIYKAVTSIAEKLKAMSDTLVSAVAKGLKDDEEDVPQ